jgi:hypothetical protein
MPTSAGKTIAAGLGRVRADGRSRAALKRFDDLPRHATLRLASESVEVMLKRRQCGLPDSRSTTSD